jgi:predicted GTPase
MYLLPLTYLFVRFFVRSYLHRKEPSQPHPTHMHAAEKAGLDALKGVSREIQKSVEMNGEISTEDEAVQKAQTQRTNGKKAQSQITDKSPIRTRSGANQKKRGTKEESEEGFSTVPPKKGAKPQTKEELEKFPDVSDVQGTNPFGVLDKTA